MAESSLPRADTSTTTGTCTIFTPSSSKYWTYTGNEWPGRNIEQWGLQQAIPTPPGSYPERAEASAAQAAGAEADAGGGTSQRLTAPSPKPILLTRTSPDLPQLPFQNLRSGDSQLLHLLENVDDDTDDDDESEEEREGGAEVGEPLEAACEEPLEKLDTAEEMGAPQEPSLPELPQMGEGGMVEGVEQHDHEQGPALEIEDEKGREDGAAIRESPVVPEVKELTTPDEEAAQQLMVPEDEEKDPASSLSLQTKPAVEGEIQTLPRWKEEEEGQARCATPKADDALAGAIMDAQKREEEDRTTLREDLVVQVEAEEAKEEMGETAVEEEDQVEDEEVATLTEKMDADKQEEEHGGDVMAAEEAMSTEADGGQVVPVALREESRREEAPISPVVPGAGEDDANEDDDEEEDESSQRHRPHISLREAASSTFIKASVALRRESPPPQCGSDNPSACAGTDGHATLRPLARSFPSLINKPLGSVHGRSPATTPPLQTPRATTGILAEDGSDKKATTTGSSQPSTPPLAGQNPLPVLPPPPALSRHSSSSSSDVDMDDDDKELDRDDEPMSFTQQVMAVKQHDWSPVKVKGQ